LAARVKGGPDNAAGLAKEEDSIGIREVEENALERVLASHEEVLGEGPCEVPLLREETGVGVLEEPSIQVGVLKIGWSTEGGVQAFGEDVGHLPKYLGKVIEAVAAEIDAKVCMVVVAGDLGLGKDGLLPAERDDRADDGAQEVKRRRRGAKRRQSPDDAPGLPAREVVGLDASKLDGGLLPLLVLRSLLRKTTEREGRDDTTSSDWWLAFRRLSTAGTRLSAPDPDLLARRPVTTGSASS
jgi:hypothetical protein